MTVRVTMVDDEAQVPEDDATPMDVDARSNGSANGDTAPDSHQLTASSSIRSRGSKVSNLRAAFEQSGSNGTSFRSFSSDRRAITPTGRATENEAELSRLKDALSKEQELKDAQNLQLAAMDAEIKTLRAAIEARDASAASATEGNDAEPAGDGQSAAAEELQLSRTHAQTLEAESNSLRKQLADVKRSIATNTRIEGNEITDAELQEELSTLSYQIQDWVVNNFRKAKVNATAEKLLAKASAMEDERQRDLLAPLYEKWDSGAKLAIFQATAVSLLMPIFEDFLLFGLPASPSWPEAVRNTAKELQEILATQDYNRWRAVTVGILGHSEVMAPFIDSAANTLAETVCKVLCSFSDMDKGEIKPAALEAIIKRAISLAHALRSQRAHYQIHLPPPGSAFDATTMEDITDHSEGDGDASIQFAIFPHVTKASDRGDDVYILFRARVSIDTP